jgi:DNA-directed RNA polymerase specialized sigma24 family protein
VGFRPLSDIELHDLDDDEALAHLVAARDAGDDAQVKLALEMLVYGRSELVEAIVAKSVPEHMVDRVVTDAMVETMATVFEGRSVGQFVNLLKVITQRRVADFWKAKSRHGHEDTTLDETDDEGGRRFDPVDPEDPIGAVPAQTILDALLEQLPDHHRAAMEVAIFDGLPSREVADEVNRRFPDLGDPMTATNVDQIKSRFRKALRDELDQGDTG